MSITYTQCLLYCTVAGELWFKSSTANIIPMIAQYTLHSINTLMGGEGGGREEREGLLPHARTDVQVACTLNSKFSLLAYTYLMNDTQSAGPCYDHSDYIHYTQEMCHVQLLEDYT